MTSGVLGLVLCAWFVSFLVGLSDRGVSFDWVMRRSDATYKFLFVLFSLLAIVSAVASGVGASWSVKQLSAKHDSLDVSAESVAADDDMQAGK